MNPGSSLLKSPVPKTPALWSQSYLYIYIYLHLLPPEARRWLFVTLRAARSLRAPSDSDQRRVPHGTTRPAAQNHGSKNKHSCQEPRHGMVKAGIKQPSLPPTPPRPTTPQQSHELKPQQLSGDCPWHFAALRAQADFLWLQMTKVLLASPCFTPQVLSYDF